MPVVRKTDFAKYLSSLREVNRANILRAGRAGRDRGRMVMGYRTGRLYRSFRVRERTSGDRTIASITSSVPYAGFHDLGFRHYISGKQVPGRHYVRAAWRAARRELRRLTGR